LLAVLAEKKDPTAESRARERDRGKALAGKSTLNRLELTPAAVEEKERYKKIAWDEGAVDRLLIEVFLESYAAAPGEIVLDLDATDDPLYGRQEGRFFHGYYVRVAEVEAAQAALPLNVGLNLDSPIAQAGFPICKVRWRNGKRQV
jgi:hypothetical protein